MSEQEVIDILTKDKYSFPFTSSREEEPPQLGGFVAWGSTAGRKWATFYKKIEEARPDTTISPRHILIRISTYPVQMFEIALPPQKLDAAVESLGNLITGIRNFVIEKGYQLKALPSAKAPPLLPRSTVDAEVTESFEGFVTELDNNIAFVTLADDAGHKSYMEIPAEDLRKNKIECKPGAIFSFLLRRRGKWEAMELTPIQHQPMTREKLDELQNYYEGKYGDV